MGSAVASINAQCCDTMYRPWTIVAISAILSSHVFLITYTPLIFLLQSPPSIRSVRPIVTNCGLSAAQGRVLVKTQKPISHSLGPVPTEDLSMESMSIHTKPRGQRPIVFNESPHRSLYITYFSDTQAENCTWIPCGISEMSLIPRGFHT